VPKPATRGIDQHLTIGKEGARSATGGGAIDSEGYFIEPTLFAAVNYDMRLACEEIFGPVAAIMPFGDVDEAVRIANDTDCGLAAAVATRNVSDAHTLAHRLRAGVVWINTHGELDLSFPFGGLKQSGLGRELGVQSLDAFTGLNGVLRR
jgi:acyl-CoA reductase-like NAD-dependent aldehyde dehydrogenase